MKDTDCKGKIIRITGCQSRSFWYSDRIGHRMVVHGDYRGDDFIIDKDLDLKLGMSPDADDLSRHCHLVDKRDCVFVKTQQIKAEI